MNDPTSERQRGLARLLAETARAHHEATGGAPDDWRRWYADYLVGKIDEFVPGNPTAETLADWLGRADARHQAEEPDAKWPPAYARYILSDYASP